MSVGLISATVITLNEEEHIGTCLASLTWCDEIIVVDSGSSDRTVPIAMEYGARVYVHPFHDYSAQKNFVAEQARCTWLLNIDADEVVTEDLRREIQQRVTEHGNAEITGYYVPRINIWLGKAIRHGGWYPDYALRLYRREHGQWSAGCHEFVQLHGSCEILRHPLIHNTTRSIQQYLRKALAFSALEVQDAQANGLQISRLLPFRVLLQSLRDFWRGPKTTLRLRLIYKVRIKYRVETAWLLPLYPALRFLYMYVLRLGFLDGSRGFWLAYASAVVEGMKALRFWEQFVLRGDQYSSSEQAPESAQKRHVSA